MLKKLFITIILGISWGIIVMLFYQFKNQNINIVSPLKKADNPVPKPLETYEIEKLSETDIPTGQLTITDVISDEDNITSNLFTFNFQPNPKNSETKKITGMVNVPKGEGKYPLILMLRGYVDQKIYQTGVGTKNASYYFADNDFITIAPDFLGYAGSDAESQNIFESRFQSYTTVLSLLASLDQIEKWDGKNIFIWGHSNGGQIALTILEITGKDIPTVLWAPVSKPFPYSVLFYTDESEDRGKLIRKELSKFEELYDVEKYSITNYFDRINTKIQINQGNADDAVAKEWSDALVKILKEKGLDIEYNIYPNADHNLRPSWDEAISKSLKYFQKTLIIQ